MSSTGVPDHNTFWGDTNDEMKEKTWMYAQRALQAMTGRFLLEQYWHPWRQDMSYEIKFNIKVFEFMGDHCDLPNGPEVFENPRDLLLYWEGNSKTEPSVHINRRLLIVEDLHPRLIKLLGVLLDIPPEFFLAHCEEFPNLGVSNTFGAPQGSSAYWKVPVPRRYDIPDSLEQRVPGSYYAKLGNFNRGEMILTDDSSRIFLTSIVSYWGRPYGAESWTSVLLIDPHHCKVEAMWDSTISCDLVDCHSLRDITREVKLEPSFDDIIQPQHRRIFDVTAEAYDMHEITTTNDPFSSTIFIRNIVRSIWEEFVHRETTTVHDLQFDDEQNQTRKGGLKSQRNLHDAPSYEKYHDLMMKRQRIREKKRDLQNIMWSFQCRTKKEDPDEEEEDTMDLMFDHRRMTLGEHESWAILEERLEAAETSLGNHLEMFAQRSALVQAEAANRMARSSGQLTKIATVIVPCSFVASIFSMGGKFEAGESLFFVYWTISVPITLVLLAWVLSKDEDSIDFFRSALSPVLQKTQGMNGIRRRWSWSKRRSREEGLELGTPQSSLNSSVSLGEYEIALYLDACTESRVNSFFLT